MRLVLRQLLVLLIAATAMADDAEEIRRLDKEISVATWTGDRLWFETNLADDYMLITPNGGIKSKIDVVRELTTPGLKMDPFDPTEVQVRLYPDTAVVTGRMLQRFTLGGIRYANDLRYTDIYVKRKGKWALVSAHVSSIAARR
jgi:hypothetical protein